MESYINKRLQHLSAIDKKKAFVMLCVVGLESYASMNDNIIDIISLNKHCGML